MLVLLVGIIVLAVAAAAWTLLKPSQRRSTRYYHFGVVRERGGYTSFAVRAANRDEAFRIALTRADSLKDSADESIVVGLI